MVSAILILPYPHMSAPAQNTFIYILSFSAPDSLVYLSTYSANIKVEYYCIPLFINVKIIFLFLFYFTYFILFII